MVLCRASQPPPRPLTNKKCTPYPARIFFLNTRGQIWSRLASDLWHFLLLDRHSTQDEIKKICCLQQDSAPEAAPDSTHIFLSVPCPRSLFSLNRSVFQRKILIQTNFESHREEAKASVPVYLAVRQLRFQMSKGILRHALVRACMRACVRACVHVCVRVCVHAG